jgi:transcriptional regulator with XRE-family HTH domain
MSSDLGEFLRARRALIGPEEAGLPVFGRRRVPGLRREEVAQLAGVSVDYYVRLEQGRGTGVSDAVLDALARVLRLDEVEHSHLRALARPGRGTRRTRTGAPPLPRPGVRLLLDSFAAPAFLLGPRMDVLAWNVLADAVSGFSARPEEARNQARYTFLDPGARDYFTDWPTVAAETVAHLRLYAGRRPGDRRLAALIGELSLDSDDFRRLWAGHQVKEKTHGVKRLRHPVAGDLDLGYETLALPGEPDQVLVVYTAPPESATAEKLAILSSWTADPTPPDPRPSQRPGGQGGAVTGG